MPELPEVETTRRGISHAIVGHKILRTTIRNPQLRWPIPSTLPKLCMGRRIAALERRGKYLLFTLDNNDSLIWHLGMSGSLRLIGEAQLCEPGPHDHVDMVFSSGMVLRYRDPRRFGALLHTTQPTNEHKLLSHLGPEPLLSSFSGDYLYARTRKRSLPIKTAIMDSKIVVGVGNIYANEALFKAGIHPLKAAGKTSRTACQNLSEHIKCVLRKAIKEGGTTLKDFTGGDGQPGYFAQKLNVYGRGGEPCVLCTKPLTEKRLAQRTTVYCTSCQR